MTRPARPARPARAPTPTRCPIYAIPATSEPDLCIPHSITDFGLQLSLYLNAKHSHLSPKRQALAFHPITGDKGGMTAWRKNTVASHKMPHIHTTAYFPSALAQARAVAFWSQAHNLKHLQRMLDVVAQTFVDLDACGVESRLKVLVKAPDANDEAADFHLKPFVLSCHETVVTLTVFQGMK